ncbi:NACHT domain-containing protein [Actinophytocola sp.]|uniref:NACHT domain-containing protein n=1 Tax=Actinophytocola sp. TaxID=1872138 RepID=UPI003899F6AE
MAAAGLVVAGAIVLVVALRSPGGLQSAGAVGGLVASLTPLVLGLVVWVRRPPSVVLAVSTVEQADAAQRQLASQVLGQWRDEIIVRQLDDPGPLAVRWRFTELDVVDRAELVSRGNPLRSLLGGGRRRFTGRTDQVGEMTAEFRKLKRRRLVLLGDPGMGKTTLAVLLLRDLLEHPEPGDPVPVLVSMSDWDPDAESLPEWLARRLAEDYPALRAGVFGPDVARSLVTQRRVLPVLDGLDELPAEVRPRVLVRLNEVAADPLVLTCRTAEYQATVTASGGDALTGGAVIEPSPLTPADAAAYLTACLPPNPGGEWQEFLTMLTRDQRSPIAEALSTPLALWLLRRVYVDTRANPAPLRDTTRFPNADAIVDNLLDHLVKVLVNTNPPRDDDDEHPFRPRHSWEPASTAETLAFLAHHLTTNGTRDLAWWQLDHVAPRSVSLMSGAIAGIALGLTVLLYEWALVGLIDGLLIAPVLGLVFGIVVGIANTLTITHVLVLTFGLNLVGAAVGTGMVEGEPVLGAALAVTGAIPIAIVAALAARAKPTDRPAYADLRLRGRTRSLWRVIVRWDRRVLAFRCVPSFAVGLVLGSLLGLAGDLPNGLFAGMVFGLVFAFATWLASGLIDWAETPVTDDRPRAPNITFHRDMRLVYVKSLAGGIALGIAFWIQNTFTSERGLATGAGIGLLVAVTIALGVGLHQPAGRYLATVVILHTRHHTPLRLLTFLDDAYRLGLLRRTGPIYQIRHARLHDRLAQKHTQPTLNN